MTVLPSTLGGPGWRPRERAHADELVAGTVWRACGVASEVAPLRAVALCRPPPSLDGVRDPASALQLAPVDRARMTTQAEALAARYRAAGVSVHWLDEPAAPPNQIFLRDTFFMTPHGAIVARMASEQRAAEPRWTAAWLAQLGIPIVATIVDGTFEGADAVWVGPRRVWIGVGKRTDRRGAEAVRRVLAGQDIEVAIVELVGPVQHLLGSVSFVADGIAVCHPEAAGEGLRRALRDHIVITPADRDELDRRRAMNFVALRPKSLLVPAHCPRLREQLERNGISTVAAEIDEYLHAAGGIACATGILEREGAA